MSEAGDSRGIGAVRRRRRYPAALTALAAVAAVAAVTLVAVARAESPGGRYGQSLDATVRFLQEDQNLDGGFGGEAGSPSDPDISSWVALALAAASVNPHDQKKPGGVDAYSYLAAHAGELKLTTDFERALMVVNAAEYPPQPLGGVDLVEGVIRGRLPNGSFTHEAGGLKPGMNDTIFAILALAPIKEPVIETVVREAAEWVIAEQNTNGSWPSWCPKSVCGRGGKDPQDSTDMTGAALEALNEAGMHETEAQARALAYLHEAQLPDGGWPQAIGEVESNVGSTAWVVQGIWASGGNPETWVDGGNEPLGYMASLQQPDGHIRYMRSREMNGVWMTSYAAPAFAGQALSIPLVPRAVTLARPTSAEQTAGSTEAPPAEAHHRSTGRSHRGGARFKRGEGVIAGGGGDGAPLFSRPKPQSKSETPGGARVVRRQGVEAKDHSQDRRGANVHQARGTERVEPRLPSEADQEAAAVSSTATTSDGGGERSSGAGGGGGDDGSGAGERGAPVPVEGSPREGSTANRDEVSGTVIGSPEGTKGKLAFGAPGLKSGGAPSGSGAAAAIAIAALLAACVGVGWEQRCGRLA
jgi:hypothetical protein